MRRSALIFGLMMGFYTVGLGCAEGQTVAPPPAVPAVPTVPATPVAAQPFSLWKFLCPPEEVTEKCKRKLCSSMFGQLLGSALGPVRMMSGGLMKPCCPTVNQPNPDDLKKAADSPAGAAARIKQEEAEAKARRADVRFLGTVDCNRYPEAEMALIKALRTDRNECVRWEAALSLGNGCCCTRNTVEALLLTANASDKDGNPVETSPRVKHAAAHALAHCQARGGDYTPEPPEKAPLAAADKVQGTAPIALTSASREAELATPPPVQHRPRGLLQNLGVPAVTSSQPSSSGDALTATPGPRGLLQTSATSAGSGTSNAGGNGPASDSGSIPTGQRGLVQMFMRRVQSPPTNTP